MNQYDVVVIGGGAAGLSAALVLSRARRTVLVVDAGSPRNAPAAHLHGYLSRDGMPPAELLAAGRKEVRATAARSSTAPSPTLSPTASGSPLSSPAGSGSPLGGCWSPTGLRDELPDIPGLRDRWARDVLHCPYCHGHEVSDRRLGVIGGTPGAVRYAQIVRQWTDDLSLLHLARHPHRRRANRSCSPAASASSKAPSTSWSSTTTTSCAACSCATAASFPSTRLFVPPRFVPNSPLLVGLGCDVDADGWVTVDTTGRTSVPGVWAAGNVVDPRAQVITAAGAGSAAAIAINADLVDEDVRDAVRDLDHGSPAPPPPTTIRSQHDHLTPQPRPEFDPARSGRRPNTNSP